MTGLDDWPGLDGMESKGIGSRGTGIGGLGSAGPWGRGLTDLLDNGLTESLTHGARDFLGGCGQAGGG